MFETLFHLWPPRVETAEQRRSLVLRSFSFLACFFILAVSQCLAVMFIPRAETVKLAKHYELSFILVFFFGLLLLLIFIFSTQVRYMLFMNWIVTFLIVECEILGIIFLAIGTNVVYLILCLIVTLLLMLLGILLGCLMPYDLTENIRFMFTLSFCAFLFSIYTAVYLSILRLTWPFFVYAGVIALMVVPVVVYHTQYVLGSGTVRVSLKDDKLAALLLFTDFLALFMLTFYWKPTHDDRQ